MKIKLLLITALLSITSLAYSQSVQPSKIQAETAKADTIQAPADPSEPGLSQQEMVNRYADWFGTLNVFAVLVVGWIFKFLKKRLTEEKKAQVAKWVALIIFVPGFIFGLIRTTQSGQLDLVTAIAVALGVASVIGLHTILINPIENLLAKWAKKTPKPIVVLK